MAKVYDLTKLIEKANYFEIEESSLVYERFHIKIEVNTDNARHIRDIINTLEEIGVDGSIEIIDFDKCDGMLVLGASTLKGKLMIGQYGDFALPFEIERGIDKLIIWSYIWNYRVTYTVNPLLMQQGIKLIAKKIEELFNTDVKIGESYNDARYTISMLFNKTPKNQVV